MLFPEVINIPNCCSSVTNALTFFPYMCNCGRALLQVGRLLGDLKGYFYRADGFFWYSKKIFQETFFVCVCLEVHFRFSELNSFTAWSGPVLEIAFETSVIFKDAYCSFRLFSSHHDSISLLLSGVGRQWFSQGFRYGDCRSLQHLLQLCCYL